MKTSKWGDMVKVRERPYTEEQLEEIYRAPGQGKSDLWTISRDELSEKLQEAGQRCLMNVYHLNERPSIATVREQLRRVHNDARALLSTLRDLDDPSLLEILKYAPSPSESSDHLKIAEDTLFRIAALANSGLKSFKEVSDLSGKASKGARKPPRTTGKSAKRGGTQRKPKDLAVKNFVRKLAGIYSEGIKEKPTFSHSSSRVLSTRSTFQTPFLRMVETALRPIWHHLPGGEKEESALTKMVERVLKEMESELEDTFSTT